MDKRTLQVAGALAVLIPMLWGAGAKVVSLYAEWSKLQSRIERLERWRCAMGSKPQGSTEWPPTDWQRECVAPRGRSEER